LQAAILAAAGADDDMDDDMDDDDLDDLDDWTTWTTWPATLPAPPRTSASAADPYRPAGQGTPVVVLTRELVRPHLTRVPVAPVTTTVRGLSTEIPVGPANGLDKACVVSCDHIVTVPRSALGRQIG
jgi:hypothetical protein